MHHPRCRQHGGPGARRRKRRSGGSGGQRHWCRCLRSRLRNDPYWDHRRLLAAVHQGLCQLAQRERRERRAEGQHDHGRVRNGPPERRLFRVRLQRRHRQRERERHSRRHERAVPCGQLHGRRRDCDRRARGLHRPRLRCTRTDPADCYRLGCRGHGHPLGDRRPGVSGPARVDLLRREEAATPCVCTIRACRAETHGKHTSDVMGGLGRVHRCDVPDRRHAAAGKGAVAQVHRRAPGRRKPYSGGIDS